MSKKKILYRNTKEGKIFGVCAGLADYLDVDVSLVRIVAVLLAFTGGGIVAYLAAAIILPVKP